ncbi:DUF1905 domain-containing protein [Phenylobacterium sp. J367]|uniref:DUF1905 domain-containing protein n=1 Tax=Phenylobacterium sp. J367 TaxID=2898435 RepID=UPI0021512844|nr:DUF1905 domain-containing protein [Phenylobacterium sp. J367]MCR5877252.1 DUF1905 domain-containing protein [Phenylobacterium sp. J367]
MRYEAECEVWLWTAETAAWHFVTLPKDVADGIRALTAGPRRGWGSVRITATIGGTSWKTSVFPEKRSGSFLLPIKAEVRTREKNLCRRHRHRGR